MKEIIEELRTKVECYINSSTDECLEYPFRDKDGYGIIQNRTNGKHLHLRVHRLVYQIANNCILNEEELILHKCDNPPCCNPRHLFKGTHTDNVRDKVNKGRQAKGSENGRYTNGYHSIYKPVDKPITSFNELFNRSLSYDQIILIKTKIQNKGLKSLTTLAEELGIKYQTIKDIYYGRSYQNIKINNVR